MADFATGGTHQQPKGWNALRKHVMDYKIDVALWATRIANLLFTIGYFIPLFWNPYNAYYKALMANAATSALRLHQRLHPVSFTRQFFMQLMTEDSCHYLFYAMIFLYVPPVTLVLLPVALFSLLHAASYSLQLLDTLGQNSWWGARLAISIVEFQSRNILRLISFTEIFLMPFTVVLILLGRAGLFTPFMYYQFLLMRYRSRRNPYTRNMFLELRALLENAANKPSTPAFLRNIIMSIVTFTCRLAPEMPAQ
ncbi:Krueppel-like protein 2 [Frankliniella fusca]|uniref:Krueppel-like protein 2 n=1 Tax=Frankliniella fusca TaxID=407009 RepID=A0AAE1LD82_9NEOP|nr:Krueppel-like protein 2 [Frankliniella fusca]